MEGGMKMHKTLGIKGFKVCLTQAEKNAERMRLMRNQSGT